jgi:hypothetical protein
LLAHGRWFSPGTPTSSSAKTGRHDIAEILLKVALKHQKLNQNQPTKKMFSDTLEDDTLMLKTPEKTIL